MLYCGYQLGDALADFGLRIVDNPLQGGQVFFEKPFKVLWGRGDIVIAEELAYEADIGPAGELQFFKAIDGAEFNAKYFRKRFYSGSARTDEGAIDIEQDQANHAPEV